MSLSTIRIWVAILMLADIAIGLGWLDRWQKLCPSISIRRVIAVEGLAVVVILVIHFWVDA